MNEARHVHYALAHYALRGVALGDPLTYLMALASDESAKFLEEMYQNAQRPFSEIEPNPGFTASDLKFYGFRLRDYPCAVIEMPPPQRMAEAYFTALVAEMESEPADSFPTVRRARYFTLELGEETDGSPRTVLCEWDDTGTHLNYGDGPPPPPTLDGFAEAILPHMRRG